MPNPVVTVDDTNVTISGNTTPDTDVVVIWKKVGDETEHKTTKRSDPTTGHVEHTEPDLPAGDYVVTIGVHKIPVKIPTNPPKTTMYTESVPVGQAMHLMAQAIGRLSPEAQAPQVAAADTGTATRAGPRTAARAPLSQPGSAARA